ncbi:MAG: ABC transporter substrate-binding protein [bacterium]|nr:ABC transporter substrate-binding protein [bacterium]
MRSLLAVFAAVLAVVVLAAGFGLAQPPARPGKQTTWKFTLDFIVQGPQAPFLVALEKGYYAAEGLNITVDRGFGSADAVTKIAGGAYNLGYADINSMIEFNARNPGRELVAIAVLLNEPPFSIITLRREGITRPIELYGKKLGAPAGDAPRRLWPLFARAVGMHPASVEWITMDVPLREPMLVRGDVNAISGFYFTSFLNLKAARVDPAEIVAFMYNDQGLPLYGNAIMAPATLLEKEPEAVRGFLRAFVRALKDTINNPSEAVAIVKRRDPLLREDVELERLQLALRHNILTKDVQSHGFGAIKGERMSRSVDLLTEAFALPVKPRWQQVFTDKFLPPKAERMLPVR